MCMASTLLTLIPYPFSLRAKGKSPKVPRHEGEGFRVRVVSSLIEPADPRRPQPHRLSDHGDRRRLEARVRGKLWQRGERPFDNTLAGDGAPLDADGGRIRIHA